MQPDCLDVLRWDIQAEKGDGGRFFQAADRQTNSPTLAKWRQFHETRCQSVYSPLWLYLIYKGSKKCAYLYPCVFCSTLAAHDILYNYSHTCTFLRLSPDPKASCACPPFLPPSSSFSVLVVEPLCSCTVLLLRPLVSLTSQL